MKVLIAQGLIRDLEKLSKADRSKAVRAIKTELGDPPDPNLENYFELEKHLLPWGDANPVWQYRLGENRIYYDFDKKNNSIIILAIQKKPSQPRIKEIL